MKEIKYRPHIDGLRAVAVIAVFLFHLLPDYFPGGYLGVDVFFVISGFVITQSLYKNYIKTGKVDIKKFYFRRFWRLYPALLFMVSSTTVAYIFWGFLWDTNLFIKSSLSSIFAFSNLYFIKHGDNYFDQGSINPLVHTWSLGIEEQFYLVYPIGLLLLLLVFKRAKVRELLLGHSLLAMTTILYVCFVYFSGEIWGDYYWPIARFWELFAGCTLFFYSTKYPLTKINNLAVLVGLALVAGSMIFKPIIDNLHVETLLAVLGTVAVIYGGLIDKLRVTKFLTYKPVLHVGVLSYSFYLWHLPVIYFLSLYANTLAYLLLSPIFSLLLAEFSYRFVESKFRYSKFPQINFKKLIKIGTLLFVGLIILLSNIGVKQITFKINTTLNSFGEIIKPINYIERKANLGERIKPKYTLGGKDVINGCNENLLKTSDGIFNKCLLKVDSQSLIYLTGDSHATHLLPAIEGAGLAADIYFQGHPRDNFIDKQVSTITNTEATLNKKTQLEEFSKSYSDIFLVTSFFLSPYEKQLNLTKKKFVDYIESYKDLATIIFIAPTPVFKTGPASCVAVGVNCYLDVETDALRREKTLDMYKELEQRYKNVYLYEPYTGLCEANECKIYDKKKDFLLYRDDNHISVEASVTLSPDFEKWFISEFGNLK